jgi:hypothetical protein
MVRSLFFPSIIALFGLLASCSTPTSTVAVSTAEDDEIYWSRNERFITDPTSAPVSDAALMPEEDYYTVPEESPLVDRERSDDGIVNGNSWNTFNSGGGMMMSWNPWMGWHMSYGPMYNRFTSWSPWGNPFYDPFNPYGFGGWNSPNMGWGWNSWNNPYYAWDTWGVMCPYGFNTWNNPWANPWANPWGGNAWGGNAWGGNVWAGNNFTGDVNGGGLSNMHRNPLSTGSFVNSSFNNTEPRIRMKPLGTGGGSSSDRPTSTQTSRGRAPSAISGSSPSTPDRMREEEDYFNGGNARTPSTSPSNSTNPFRSSQPAATQPGTRDTDSREREISPSRTTPRTVTPSPSRGSERTPSVTPSPSRSMDRSPSVSPSPSRSSGGSSPSRSGGGSAPSGGRRR